MNEKQLTRFCSNVRRLFPARLSEEHIAEGFRSVKVEEAGYAGPKEHNLHFSIELQNSFFTREETEKRLGEILSAILPKSTPDGLKGQLKFTIEPLQKGMPRLVLR